MSPSITLSVLLSSAPPSEPPPAHHIQPWVPSSDPEPAPARRLSAEAQARLEKRQLLEAWATELRSNPAAWKSRPKVHVGLMVGGGAAMALGGSVLFSGAIVGEDCAVWSGLAVLGAGTAVLAAGFGVGVKYRRIRRRWLQQYQLSLAPVGDLGAGHLLLSGRF